MAFLIYLGFFAYFSLDLGQLKYWQIYQSIVYIEARIITGIKIKTQF